MSGSPLDVPLYVLSQEVFFNIGHGFPRSWPVTTAPWPLKRWRVARRAWQCRRWMLWPSRGSSRSKAGSFRLISPLIYDVFRRLREPNGQSVLRFGRREVWPPGVQAAPGPHEWTSLPVVRNRNEMGSGSARKRRR